jgi:UDP-N-acetylmuramoylalanine--D-glutamate ligase
MQCDYRNKKVIVVGAGRTGLALTRYFSRRGAAVTLSDNRSAEKIAQLEVVQGMNVNLDLGGHTRALFEKADLVVISPGVALTTPAVTAALNKGVSVLGEIEVAFHELSAPLAAITGTNGKSTTTALMGEIFQAWGKRTFVGGNLGTPLIEAVRRTDWDWIVGEISSFQLEAIHDFRPRYALLLNITEDHLDRYPDMAGYVAAKLRIFENMAGSDVAVLNAEDSLVLDAGKTIKPNRVLFSSCRLLPEGMGFEDGDIVWRMDGAEKRFNARQLRLKGLHNVENVMAALIPPLMEGCPSEIAWKAACDFTGLAYRMVEVRQLDGVSWYNDSKGTNVGSIVKGLAGLTSPVTLIAGGKDKGGEYAPLVDLVRDKVVHLILIGQAAQRMAAVLGDLTHTEQASSLEEAVRLARELTPRGGSVLFSPGCSSFDMFKNFEERGEVFTRVVLDLPEREAV